MIMSPGLAASIADWIVWPAASSVGCLPPMVTVTVSIDCLPAAVVITSSPQFAAETGGLAPAGPPYLLCCWTAQADPPEGARKEIGVSPQVTLGPGTRLSATFSVPVAVPNP